ncbi:MAG: DNA-processing protein DprA [Bacteroidia bacterium]
MLGHGFSTLYPSANKSLSEEMLHHGALITEFPFHVRGKKENFPKRNRIVAAMCDALIVVESAMKGGSLITADLANGYNKDVYALPGKLSDGMSAGCNALIHKHQAAIISSIDELIFDLGYTDTPKNIKQKAPDLFSTLSDEEQRLIKLLEGGEMTIDNIHYETGIAINRLAFLLLNLEFANLVNVLPGKTYVLCQSNSH